MNSNVFTHTPYLIYIYSMMLYNFNFVLYPLFLYYIKVFNNKYLIFIIIQNTKIKTWVNHNIMERATNSEHNT